MSNWMFACVNQGEDSDPPEAPTPVPRPGDSAKDEDGEQADQEGRSPSTEEGEAVSPQAIARFFG
ncbi:hypothetical protein [Streptomyces sp. NPDC093089]|uniref:hypothetical protein n=1 Tax=Streptomyces sp. NPDC093089 TaxID=3366024 RepID=UPI0038225266